MYAVLCQQHRTWILCLRCLRFDLNENMSAYMRCIRTLLHEFALTYNTIEKLVSMFGALTRGRAPSSGKSLQSRELLPSQQWDEIRLRVSRRGGGGRWDILIILLSLLICFYSAINSLYTCNKTFTKPHCINSSIHLHLPDAFIQSDLHCIQVTVSTFYQLLLSLGIEPMILALLTPCSTSWATGHLPNYYQKYF